MRDRIFCESLKDYQQLKKETTLLKSEENINLFIISMALGYKNKSKVRLKKREGLVNIKTFDKDNEIMAMISAVALTDTKKFDTLLNDEEMYTIAEEYANGGLKFLKPLLVNTDPTSFIKKMSGELLDIIKSKSK